VRDPFATARLRLTHILDEVQFIREATGDRPIRQVFANPTLRRAIERALSIISEAARHLPDSLTNEQPLIAWREVRRVGDVLRHAYDRIDPDVIKRILTLELDALQHACETILASLPPDEN
jgi:uncharacterized protein with HEPN domain